MHSSIPLRCFTWSLKLAKALCKLVTLSPASKQLNTHVLCTEFGACTSNTVLHGIPRPALIAIALPHMAYFNALAIACHSFIKACLGAMISPLPQFVKHSASLCTFLFTALKFSDQSFWCARSCNLHICSGVMHGSEFGVTSIYIASCT